MTDARDEILLNADEKDLLRVEPASSGLRWCCLYTRPRHEKSAALTCKRLDIELYLPLRRVTRRYKSGKKIRWIPLFPGYVFCLPSTDQRIELSRVERVLSIIDVVDQDRFVDELRQICRGLQVSAELDTVPYLASGQQVEIARGPFKGVRGVVENIKGRFRVMLIATMINRSVPIEVDMDDVEPAGQ